MRWLFGIIASGAVVGPLLAADLAPYDRLPVSSWTGVYIGANAGWIGSSGNTISNSGTDTGPGGLGSALALGLIPGSVGASHTGFSGGGQIGYNWQVNPSWVSGVEADFDGGGGKRSVAATYPGNAAFVPMTSVFTRQLDTLGTVRGRVGFLSSSYLLWYATGGLAYGETKLGSAWGCPACFPPTTTQGSTALLTSNTSVGWTLGAGVEWNFAPAWSVKAEYLYVDLGNQSNTIAYNYTGWNSTLTSTVNERDNIVRVGVNYKLF